MMAPLPDRTPRASRNLVTDGGFRQDAGGPGSPWRACPVGAVVEKIACGGFNALGLPHSAGAVVLGGAPGAAHGVSQTVALPDAAALRFALRIASRGGACRLVVRQAGDAGRVLHEAGFGPSDAWRRCRSEFALATGETALEVAILAETDGGRVEATDVRLVALDPEQGRFAIRFDTRGDMRLPSSRLRAFLLADRLDLLGWRVSVNEGRGHDLLVCQKVTRWAGLAAARLRGAKVIFDLDDNELAEGRLRATHLASFARCSDGVTVGGEFLQERLSRPCIRPFLLDNPVDILDPGIIRPEGGWRGRLVWFGMPENLWMVRAVESPEPVTCITRGGDIEYDLETIDATLTGFDLALLPVTLNDHTKAKNANRLVKCAGLGLPFLASDTPEHRRALARIGLSERFLVPQGQGWAERIGAAARDYPALRAEIAAARDVVFAEYGVERITDDWLGYCRSVMGRGG